MIFYSYEDLFIAARGNASLMIRYLDFSTGYDFLVEDYPLYLDVDIQYKAEYLGIAALRGIDYYMMTRDSSLSIEYIPPEYDLNLIKNNPLIKVEGDIITFPYETLDT